MILWFNVLSPPTTSGVRGKSQHGCNFARPKENDKTRLTASHKHICLRILSVSPMFYAVISFSIKFGWSSSTNKVIKGHWLTWLGFWNYNAVSLAYEPSSIHGRKKKITAGRKLCKSGLIRENTLKVGSQKWKRLFLILVWKAHKEGISKSNNLCKGNGQLAAAAIF